MPSPRTYAIEVSDSMALQWARWRPLSDLADTMRIALLGDRRAEMQLRWDSPPRPTYYLPEEVVVVIAGELQGHRGVVCAHWLDSRAVVWVLTDAGDNPLPFKPEELRRA